MPGKPMRTTVRHANAGPLVTAEQMREICDRLASLATVLTDLDSRLSALEADPDVQAVVI